MVKRILITCSLILSAMTVTAFAEEEGYIFKLKDDAVIPFSVVDGVERLTSDAPVYSADSLEDVYDFVDESVIECIGPDAPVYLFGEDDENFGDTPNDKYYGGYQWNLPMINIPSVWAKGYRGEGSTICVIDSGVNISHEDIDEDNIVGKYNIFDGSSDVTDFLGYTYTLTEAGKGNYSLNEKGEYVPDKNGNYIRSGEKGHGTFVTGTINAVTNNGKGIAGIADKAKIIAIKAFDDKHTTNISTLISALDKAAQYDDIDVINMSLGTTDKLVSGTKKTFRAAIDSFVEKGIIIIAAVGNDGNSNVSYPAGFENVIGVGGVARSKKKCYFSQMNESVFVVAPGGIEKKGENGGLAGLSHVEDDAVMLGSGTSYSTPQVSAVAAIAKTIYPELTTEEFKKILIKTSEDLGDTGYDTYYGWGLINAEKIIEEVEKLAGYPSVTATPTVKPVNSPTPTPKFTVNPYNYRNLKYNPEIKCITVESNDDEATVFAANYASDGTLLSVKVYKLRDQVEDHGTYEIHLESSEKAPSKLFLWHGLQNCVDSWVNDDYVLATAKPTPEPTPEPTAEPTAEPVTNAKLSNSLISCINDARAKANIKDLIISDKAMDILDSYTKDIFVNGFDQNTMKDSSGKTPMDYISEIDGKEITWALYPIQDPSGTFAPDGIAEYMLDQYSYKLLADEYTHIAAGTMGDDKSRMWVVITFSYVE